MWCFVDTEKQTVGGGLFPLVGSNKNDVETQLHDYCNAVSKQSCLKMGPLIF